MHYIISYDIPDDKRRTRLAKLLEKNGIRVQYSVFECELTHGQFAGLRRDIEYLLNFEEDNLRIYRLCADCADAIERVGVKGVFENVSAPCYLVL